MFEKFTEKAKRILFLARYEAAQQGARAIGTEHVLLGLLKEGEETTRELFTRASGSTAWQPVPWRLAPAFLAGRCWDWDSRRRDRIGRQAPPDIHRLRRARPAASWHCDPPPRGILRQARCRRTGLPYRTWNTLGLKPA